MYRQNALILGSGSFPIDMLRFDTAFPTSEHDAGLIEATFQPRERGIFLISVSRYVDVKHKFWTVDRWRSFNTQILPDPDTCALADARDLYSAYVSASTVWDRKTLRNRIAVFFANGGREKE